MKLKLFLVPFLATMLYLAGYGQVIQAPDLQCVNNDQVNGDITLYWTNPPANGCGAFVQYTIYGSPTGPGGPYTATAVTNQAATSYLFAGALGISSTWYYYIEASYNCPGATVLQSDTVNNLNPTTPTIVNVNVTPGGQVEFNWLPGPSPQTQCYVIYYYLPNGLAVFLDSICGYDSTSYLDISGDPTSGPLVYTIAARDSCGKISAYSTYPHNTIYATAASQACQSQVDLAWNRYINWPQSVLRYEVWVSRNDSAFAKVAEVDTSNLVYNYSGFNDGDSLCIYIKSVSAADSNITSNSNYICMKASIVQPPRYNYITNATVELNNHITVSWLIDSLAELIYYKVQNSTNDITYRPVIQIPAPSPLRRFESMEDSSGVMPQNNPYYYKIVAIDSCQTQFESPKVKTVNLKGELYDYYMANLVWNDFELFGATVTHYNLYRNITGTYQLIRTFAPGTNTYSDSLQQFLDANGIFCYRIEAVYNLDLPLANYTATLSSWSNEQCIIHRPIIYIPNAFAPNGVNNVFKPTIIYGEPKGYVMTIFNRYGGKVFESTDPAVGWDGIDHGKEAQLGAYAYLIQFYANDGVQVERKGMVLLVK